MSLVSRAWYFAYGSNMDPATLRGRRGIDFFRALPARLEGWRLVLDKPTLVFAGEGVANIVADAAAAVLGVAYEIAETELEHLDLTEGVLIGNYRRVAVPVVTLADPAAPLDAFTLVSDHREPGLVPSTRYMAHLIAGAETHGLPPEYVAFLRGLPARPSSEEARSLQPYIDEALRTRKRGSE